MKVGSLFSGGGLGDFGFLVAGMEISWQCEIDEYCQKILALRYPDSKKYWDIKTLKGSDLESVDIITGGFPCQPFSVAGKQQGVNDNRHLWPEMFRIISEVRPAWVVGENVYGFIKLGLDLVLNDLESIGYEATTIVFPAHALGAPHRRERVWIVGNAKHNGPSKAEAGRSMYEPQEPSKQDQGIKSSGTGDLSEDVANTGLLGQKKRQEQTAGIKQCCEIFRRWWSIEPNVGRVANGIADRVHRLRMLGNGQVPACTYTIGRMIMDIENAKY